MKRYTLGLALLGLASPLFAQNETDALRYSRLQFGGGARTLGIGGANVAVGADIGNLSSNPAGLGLFQRSELTLSPGLGFNTATARANNVSGSANVSDSRNNLQVANIGLVIANRRPDGENSDWRGGTLAIGFTRVNDFNARFRYNNANLADDRSLFQRLREPRISVDDIDQQFGDDQFNSLDGLAYGAYLTDIFADNNNREFIGTPNVLLRSSVNQEETVLTTGSQTQFDIGYGGSYRDRLYIGGAIGIVSTRFNSTSELRESVDPAANTSFGSLLLRDELETRGTGFNARLGVIYRPVDWLRVGASAQSPTAFQFDDSYQTSLSTQFKQPIRVDGQSISSASVETEPGVYSYRLTTPWRLNGGAAAIIGKYGFVSADVELVDYSRARLRGDDQLENGDDYSFNVENDRVSDLYKQAVNVRVGGEARFDAFRLRAGYANYGDPYRNSNFDRTQHFVTGGVGFRQNNFTLDLAGVYNTSNRFYSPYTLADRSQPVVEVNGNRLNTTVTLGFQF